MESNPSDLPPVWTATGFFFPTGGLSRQERARGPGWRPRVAGSRPRDGDLTWPRAPCPEAQPSGRRG